jgi:hypothetical protein
MNSNRFHSVLSRSIRFVVIMFACTVLLISNALPASAIGAPRTSTDKGSVQLDDIQAKSEEVTKAPPLSGGETQREANRGINEIQGDANKDQMFRPENSRGTTVTDRVEEALENITGRD